MALPDGSKVEISEEKKEEDQKPDEVKKQKRSKVNVAQNGGKPPS